MSGVMSQVRAILESRAPGNLPPAAVTTYFPNLDNPLPLACAAGANAYGNNATALLGVGNLTGLWVVGIYGCIFSRATMDYHICVNGDPTGVPPVTILAEAPFWAQTTTVADNHQYVPFYRPVYIPAGNIVCLAASNGQAAADTCAAWAICVVNMEN